MNIYKHKIFRPYRIQLYEILLHEKRRNPQRFIFFLNNGAKLRVKLSMPTANFVTFLFAKAFLGKEGN